MKFVSNSQKLEFHGALYGLVGILVLLLGIGFVLVRQSLGVPLKTEGAQMVVAATVVITLYLLIRGARVSKNGHRNTVEKTH